MMILVGVPAFNEGKNIGDIVTRILKHADEVVVCDDGSNDNTSYEAKKAGAIIIRHEKNKGKGAALKSLFNYAIDTDADIFVTIDGDGQFLPEEIPLLIEPIKEQHSDIVIGYRFDKSDEMPSYRKVGNKILDHMTNLASTLQFRDTQSGFRSYSRNAFSSITFSSDGFAADSEILIIASEKKLKISEKKVSVLYNIENSTSTKNPISHSIGVSTSLIEMIAIRNPLMYLGIPGIFLTAIGILSIVFVMNIFNVDGYFSIPITLFSLASLVVGVMLILMSFVLFSVTKVNKS